MSTIDQSVHGLLASGSQPIAPQLRLILENRLGVDLRRVRLHLNPEASASARALNARAYTVGRHVVFAENEFRPWERGGFGLLVHELTHAVQQNFADPHGASLALDPDPLCEALADSAAESMGARSEVRRLHSPAIQRHPGPPCPSPPRWVQITSLRPRELWLPANQAIEMAYLASYPNHVVLFGSQFEGWRDIRLPRGTPNRGADDAILNALRGRSQQRAPDIIDFTDRVFYEIKTVGYAGDGMDQLMTLHTLIGAIGRQHGGPHWNPDLASWYPPHVLPFPGDPQKSVCTAATTHSQSPAGLILYKVFRRTSPEEERQLQRRAVAITDLERELEPMRERLINELVRVTGDTTPGTDLWIIASPQFWRRFVIAPQEERMERTLDLMRVHGMDSRRNPVMGFRYLGWTLIGIGATLIAMTFLVVMTGGVALEAAAAGTVGTAGVAAETTAVSAGAISAEATAAGAAGITASEAEVISLTAFRAARAAAASQRVAAAAGVLFVLTTTSVSRAQGHAATVTGTEAALRAVPGHLVGPEAHYRIGRPVLYSGGQYIIAGRAVVR